MRKSSDLIDQGTGTNDGFVTLLNANCRLFSVDTNKANGGVLVNANDVIVWTPPYFRFLLGSTLEESTKLVKSIHGVYT